MGKGGRGVTALAAAAAALALMAMMMSGAGVEAACDSEAQQLVNACAKYVGGNPGADCCSAGRSIPSSSYPCLCAKAQALGVSPATIKNFIAACNLGIPYPCNY